MLAYHQTSTGSTPCVNFAGLGAIAAGPVVLTAGGNHRPTLTQCLLNDGPVSLVLAVHAVSIQP